MNRHLRISMRRFVDELIQVLFVVKLVEIRKSSEIFVHCTELYGNILSMERRFHLLNNLIGTSSSILKKLVQIPRGIFIGQRAFNILWSNMISIAEPLINKNAQFRLDAKSNPM